MVLTTKLRKNIIAFISMEIDSINNISKESFLCKLTQFFNFIHMIR